MLLTGTKEESGLNIVISTEHNQLFRQLYAAADAAISNRHLRGMELYAFRSLTPEELIKEAAGCTGQAYIFQQSNYGLHSEQ